MILKFKPILFEKVWGGRILGIMYNKNNFNLGECWGISGLESQSNIIESGKFSGKTLHYIYQNNRELFGNYKSDEFPILVKYIDAEKDLSIQVHPNDEYARKYENSNGKEEYWYILRTKNNSKIIIGHSANSKDEIKNSLKEDTILDKVNIHDIKDDDYFYVPSGTLHSICSGTFLLEVSQSSDITYRLYDYKRLSNIKERELNVDKALDVINIPDTSLIEKHRNKYFTFDIKINQGSKIEKSHKYGDYISIIEGEGFFGNYRIKAGDFLMVSSNQKYRIEGSLKYQLSTLL